MSRNSFDTAELIDQARRDLPRKLARLEKKVHALHARIDAMRADMLDGDVSGPNTGNENAPQQRGESEN